MLFFKEYLLESLDVEKLKHLEHAEDHVIHGGHEGVSHAASTLEDVHKFLQNKKQSSKVTVKYDGCLHEDTEILLSDGSSSTIKNLITNWSLANPQEVVGVDDSGGLVIMDIVDILSSMTDKKWIKIFFSEDNYLILTEDHEIMTQDGWKQAKDIAPGDDISELDYYK